MEELGESEVLIMCDFNANINGDFFSFWADLITEHDMVFSGVSRLNEGILSHVKHGILSTSWLDHCFSSRTIDNAMQNIAVDNTYVGSDHFPLHVEIAIDGLPRYVTNVCSSVSEIDWIFSHMQKIEAFRRMLHNKLIEAYNIRLCQLDNCSNPEHKDLLKRSLNLFTKTVLSCGDKVFSAKSKKHPIVPGWNAHVRRLYATS